MRKAMNPIGQIINRDKIQRAMGRPRATLVARAKNITREKAGFSPTRVKNPTKDQADDYKQKVYEYKRNRKARATAALSEVGQNARRFRSDTVFRTLPIGLAAYYAGTRHKDISRMITGTDRRKEDNTKKSIRMNRDISSLCKRLSND